jgi:hypothetical protein
MPIHQHVKDLLREIEAYCRRKQITRTDFSNRITGGGHLVRRMYLGQQPRLSTIDRIRRYMKEHP